MPPTLTGQWIARENGIVGDDVCREIESMIAHHLDEIGHDSSGWYTLFRDRRDGGLWERSYPLGHMHGGGPPQLASVTLAEARLRYASFVA
jgi:hypothetical protein